MTEIEAYEYVIQLYPKCGLKTVAVFGMDITPYLKHGFRDVQYEPKDGEFDLLVDIQFSGTIPHILKKSGILLSTFYIFSDNYIQIHSGKLNAYKRKA